MSKKYRDVELQIRPAQKEDMKAVAEMIQELAEFEKMPDGPKMSIEDLERDGFSRDPPAFQCIVADVPRSGVVGYALYFRTYSTWRGAALMLEDLYVRAEHRRRGVGGALLKAVAKEACSLGSGRLDFHVLEWNPARAFYARAGAADLTRTEQWRYYRLHGAALAALAGGAGAYDVPTHSS